MPDQKISAFTALTVPASADELPIVDVDVVETKKITVSNLIYTWISDVDVGGFNLTSIGNLQFGTDTGQPAASVMYVRDDTTGLKINVPSGDLIKFYYGNNLSQTFSETSMNLDGDNILNIGYQDVDRIADPGNPSTDHGRLYVKQEDANNDSLYLRIKKAGSFVEVKVA